MMNKNAVSKLLVVGVVVIVVVAAGVAAYWLLANPGGTGGQTGSEETGGETAPNVASANSLQFDVIATINGVQEQYRFIAKNIGTSNLMIRVDQTDPQGNAFKYIINSAEQKVWVYYNGDWMDMSAQFSTYWDQWKPAFDGYRSSLEGWSGTGDYEYTANGNTFKITNIIVNPTLADSLFQPGGH
ncbi:MAG: hypothetical protein N3E52_05460 [Candidatus Bathyarchaeota archaeon]|nr:hypothetical protein [Candidatus Bathyarchaeota archaeon]